MRSPTWWGSTDEEDTFRSLRIDNFRLFFLGQLTSQVGTWMQMIAVIWVVLQRTDNGFTLGLVSAAQFLPVLMFGARGGVIADRVDHHRFMLGTQVAFTVISAAFVGLILTDRLYIRAISVLSLVIARRRDVPIHLLAWAAIWLGVSMALLTLAPHFVFALIAVIPVGIATFDGPIVGWASESFGSSAGILIGALASILAGLWIVSEQNRLGIQPPHLEAGGRTRDGERPRHHPHLTPAPPMTAAARPRPESWTSGPLGCRVRRRHSRMGDRSEQFGNVR